MLKNSFQVYKTAFYAISLKKRPKRTGVGVGVGMGWDSVEDHLVCIESLGSTPSTIHSNQEIQILPSEGHTLRNRRRGLTRKCPSTSKLKPSPEKPRPTTDPLNNAGPIGSGAISIYLRPHFKRSRNPLPQTEVGKPWAQGCTTPAGRHVRTDGFAVRRPESVELQAIAAKQP